MALSSTHWFSPARELDLDGMPSFNRWQDIVATIVALLTASAKFASAAYLCGIVADK